MNNKTYKLTSVEKTGRILGVAFLSLLVMSGCREDSLSLDVPGRDRFIWSMELNHKAIVMSTQAPYDTIKLTPKVYNIRGEEIEYGGAITYTSNGPQVEVASDGTLLAKGTITNLRVIASTTDHNVTLTDTAMITVIGTSPTVKMNSFSIQQPSGDSAKVAMSSFGVNRTKSLAATVLDADEKPISPVSVFYKVSDPSIASINRSTGMLTTNTMGDVMVYAYTTIFGVSKMDSLKVTVGPPLLNYVTVLGRVMNSDTVTSFAADSILIGVGGTVRWTNASRRIVNVVFEDSLKVSGVTPLETGNIPAWGPVGTDTFPVRQRVFNAPGVFKYKSSVSGGSGVVVVK